MKFQQQRRQRRRNHRRDILSNKIISITIGYNLLIVLLFNSLLLLLLLIPAPSLSFSPCTQLHHTRNTSSPSSSSLVQHHHHHYRIHNNNNNNNNHNNNDISTASILLLLKMSNSNNDKNNDDNDDQQQEDSSSSSSPSNSNVLLTKEEKEMAIESRNRRNLIYNTLITGLLGISGVASWSLFQTSVYTPPGFRRLPTTQFIAALGDPNSNSGGEAKSWGLWNSDPGPRGVFLKNYQRDIVATDNVSPVGWEFNKEDWWLEEHGIIMESPIFPIEPGRYLVTGGRLVTTILTIDDDGNWKLDDGVLLYDVTHLPCRSARYTTPTTTSENKGGGSSPLTANLQDFPVKPGAEMPNVTGCNKQDYSVLFLIGKEIII